MNIYVGNLSYGMSEAELRDAFGAFGEVSSVKILMDRETGRSRGFGFVEMPNPNEAQAAISQRNGKVPRWASAAHQRSAAKSAAKRGNATVPASPSCWSSGTQA